MKKLYFLLMALCFFTISKAQVITIPDANFKAKLLAANTSNDIARDSNNISIKIDINNNGEIEINEALPVSQLNLGSASIADLTGIQSFKNLVILDCGDNQLSSLNVMGLDKLGVLYCQVNQLTDLNVSGLSNLKELDCASNKFTDIDVLSLKNLEYLNCTFNQLVSLNVSGLTKLGKLGFNHNQLTSINLTGLTKLEELQCSNNQLTYIDLTGLTNLTHLWCNDNQLITLDVSSLVNLSFLSCINNKLSSLDFSNLTKLEHLFCYENQLVFIDLAGSTNISYLYCDNNPNLTTLFMKGVVNFDNVVFYHCPKLSYICTDDKFIDKVKAMTDKEGYTCNINSYCSFNPGGTFYNIQGIAKLDTENNGCDENDAVYPNLKFSIKDGTKTGSLISNISGNYSLPVQAGTYTVTPVIENPTFFNVSPASINVNFPEQSSPFTQNFCITPNGMHKDLEVILLPIGAARPGFDAKYKIIYKNNGTQTLSGSVNLQFGDDTLLDVVISNPVVSSQTTNNLFWNFNDLVPFESREIEITININSPMETPAVNAGDILSFIANVFPKAEDLSPLNNTSALRQVIVNSLDPNDKTCLEGKNIGREMIGKEVHYMIRFENTGTYPAENIVVKDKIDATKFDVSSLIPMNASHPFVTRINNGNIVEFIFENINLPFEDANNDGYIVFKIKTLPTLDYKDTFENQASIYFDYNYPIVTNKAISTFAPLGVQDFEFSKYFSLYPNPAKAVLNLSVKNTIEVNSISVYNMLGQMVIAVVPNAKTVSAVDISKLISGTYFIKANTDKGTATEKFVKN